MYTHALVGFSTVNKPMKSQGTTTTSETNSNWTTAPANDLSLSPFPFFISSFIFYSEQANEISGHYNDERNKQQLDNGAGQWPLPLFSLSLLYILIHYLQWTSQWNLRALQRRAKRTTIGQRLRPMTSHFRLLWALPRSSNNNKHHNRSASSITSRTITKRDSKRR